jgi:cytochrome c553
MQRLRTMAASLGGLILACLWLRPALAQQPVVVATAPAACLPALAGWAYPVNPPGFAATVLPDAPLRVPGSRRSFRPAQLQDLFNAPDWYPHEHPDMPDVVAHGRRPSLYACAYCHRPDGSGGPENASLAGLPAAYIVQQLADFKAARRGTAEPGRLPARLMAELSGSLGAAEIDVATEYFSRLQPHSHVSVIESDTAPRTRVANWLLAADPAAPREALGQRIIEVPVELGQVERRDAHARFIAYVPVGSIAAGRALVQSGGASTLFACTLCHGPALGGQGPVPPLAGRSPSYIVRQLLDIQCGARAGSGVAPMQAVTRQLRLDEIIALAAYLASLP